MLVLSHLLDEDCTNEYAQEVIKRKASTGWHIVLDNWLYENHVPESGEILWRKAYKIWATTVFAPDYLYDRLKTKMALQLFMQIGYTMSSQYNIVLPKCSYVVQADNVFDYLEEYEEASKYDVHMIGMSILSVPKSFSELTWTDDISINRAVAISMIDKAPYKKKDTHLLGLGNSLIDISMASQVDRCISNDSSVPFWAQVVDGSTYNQYGWLTNAKPKKHLDFNLQELSSEKLVNVVSNIDYVKATSK